MASPSSQEFSDTEPRSIVASEQSAGDDYDEDDDGFEFSVPDAGLGLIEQGTTLGLDDYIHDILITYRREENLRRPAGDYLATQKELDEDMRWEVSDWMIKKHHELELRPAILYLAFYIVDRYLSLRNVAAPELHLVGATALFLASKYHERWGCPARHLASFSTSMEASMIEKEKDILRKLEWNLNAPTPHEFLTAFLKAGGDLDEEMQFAAFFFGELGLMDYSAVRRLPSLRAASALYTARCTLGRTPLWPDQLVQATNYAELQLLETAESLVRLHAMVKSSEGNKPKAVYDKYAAADRKAVASRPPATLVMEKGKGKAKAKFLSVCGTLGSYTRRIRRAARRSSKS